jgi:hypothetical protein
LAEKGVAHKGPAQDPWRFLAAGRLPRATFVAIAGPIKQENVGTPLGRPRLPRNELRHCKTIGFSDQTIAALDQSSGLHPARRSGDLYAK